jgi:hypothetical protein
MKPPFTGGFFFGFGLFTGFRVKWLWMTVM